MSTDLAKDLTESAKMLRVASLTLHSSLILEGNDQKDRGKVILNRLYITV